MTVDAAQLRTDLLAFFIAPPATSALCATEWGTIMEDYATPVVPPSATVAAAAVTLEAAMAAAFLTPAAAAALDTAFAAFAATVFGGMPPMSPAAPTAPGWAATLLVTAATHDAGADNFRDFINVWFTSTGWS